MPRSPIQIHLYRTMVRHNVARLQLDVDYPVTGVVVVPSNLSDINGYIKDRQLILAQLRMPHLVGTPGYSNTVAAMAFRSDIRRGMGLDPQMPPTGLTHSQAAADCEGCRIIGRCTYNNPDQYLQLRAQLERICNNVTKYDSSFREALEIQLNTTGVQ